MDIIGFEDQIGANRDCKKMVFKKPVLKNKKTWWQTAGRFGVVPFGMKKINKKKMLMQVKTPFGVKKVLATKIPKSVFQKKMAIKKPFNLAPTATKIPKNVFLKKMASKKPFRLAPSGMFKKLSAMTPTNKVRSLFNAKVTPAFVKSIDSVDRSFLKTDLPYQPLSNNNNGQRKSMKIPNTPLKLSLNIDSIQPPVDGGISNYYGK